MSMTLHLELLEIKSLVGTYYAGDIQGDIKKRKKRRKKNCPEIIWTVSCFVLVIYKNKSNINNIQFYYYLDIVP